MKLFNVMQGSADVMGDNGYCIGSVAQSMAHRGWWAYNANGRRISEYPNPKRAFAVREVIKANEQA